jgi:hypothetical protein
MHRECGFEQGPLAREIHIINEIDQEQCRGMEKRFHASGDMTPKPQLTAEICVIIWQVQTPRFSRSR